MKDYKPFITILTPSYNRSSNLQYLYRSLEDQTNCDFQWVIVDDGSTDDTEQVVSSIYECAGFPIIYLKKANGGKHTALNTGIEFISTPLTFIVDSDDKVTSDAVESIEKVYERYKNRKDICGYSFLRKYPDGKINGKPFSQNGLIDTYINTRVNTGDMGSDKAEVFITQCLKDNPFPVFMNNSGEYEKFLGEDVVWVQLARKYNMVHFNKAIYIGDYLSDGLTNNRRNHNIESPMGCSFRAKQYLSEDINIKFREKSALQYLIYGWFAGENTKELIDSAPMKHLVQVNIIPAKIIYSRWRKQYEASKVKEG